MVLRAAAVSTLCVGSDAGGVQLQDTLSMLQGNVRQEKSQRPRTPLRSGRIRVGSIPLGMGGRAPPSAFSRAAT
jgi:hypothetical protein